MVIDRSKLSKLLTLQQVETVMSGIDLLVWGRIINYTAYLDGRTVIVNTIHGSDLVRAADRYSEAMSVNCSESIADFQAERELYLDVKRRTHLIDEDKEYYMNHRTVRREG